MNSPHLSATAEIAATLRARAQESRPSFCPIAIATANLPSVSVMGHDGDPAIIGMLMRACGHVILYQRDLPIDEQRVKIAHSLAHMIFDGGGRDGACTHRPDEEQRAWSLVNDLLIPVRDLAPRVYRWPPVESREDDIYLDQVDMLASHFVVPQRFIDQRIRWLQQNITNSDI